VSTFSGVVYDALWRRIDAHVIAQPDGMKYEFHLAPGADPQDIALRYTGVERLSLTQSGGLSIRTPAGTITDDAPIAWQTVATSSRTRSRRRVRMTQPCRWCSIRSLCLGVISAVVR
jgi:hypothetical protein